MRERRTLTMEVALFDNLRSKGFPDGLEGRVPLDWLDERTIVDDCSWMILLFNVTSIGARLAPDWCLSWPLFWAERRPADDKTYHRPHHLCRP